MEKQGDNASRTFALSASFDQINEFFKLSKQGTICLTREATVSLNQIMKEDQLDSQDEG